MWFWGGRRWDLLLLPAECLFQLFRTEQVFDAIEDLLARTATDEAGAQLQLVMRDPEGRLAMWALGSERHRYLIGGGLAGEGDPAFALGPYGQLDEGGVGCRDFVGLTFEDTGQDQPATRRDAG